MSTQINIEKIRLDFPILSNLINNKPYIYLDNGATSQKPKQVIDAITQYYYTVNSNVHRGVHHLSQQSTELFEQSREKVKDFLQAKSVKEIVFSRGTTESINLVANVFGNAYLDSNSEIIISELEHHSNMVPWQMQAKKTGATIKYIPFNERGILDIEAYKQSFSNNTKIVAISHVSNALGIVNPVKEMVEIAHTHHVPVLVDGAQAVPHMKVDVQELDCDFYCFSGHKMYAPTGIGVLYGKEEWLKKLPPYHGGGEMIETVTTEGFTLNQLPYKFEAGTPNIADAIGLGAAIDYMNSIGMEEIYHHEKELMEYGHKKLSDIDGITIYGDANHKMGVISFLVNDIHPFDMGTILDKMNVAVRTGHHCAQPVMDRLNISGTVRASFAIYNTKEEIDKLAEAITFARDMLM